ncbi:hypothetical protein ACFYNO_31320 [Kitasatospora sp. NPDC006697]|uniref:hypothetical protein n=1 Tax=Kitasatospora sp. NPDC006697 TaxID=3364020 RepID=UPI0036C53836
MTISLCRDPGNTEGDLIVRSLVQGPLTGPGGPVSAGEIHYFPFTADLRCGDLTTPTPTPSSTPSPAPSPTRSPSSGPSPSAGTTPSPFPSSAASPHPSRTPGPELAATGSDAPPLPLLTAAGALGPVGAVLLGFARRRR